MRSSWLIGALVCFIIGFILSLTIIGAIIGLPLIFLSFILLVLGLILPSQKSVMNVNQVQKIYVASRNKKKK